MSSYVLKNIDMTLDRHSINRAINEVKRFKRELTDAMTGLCNALMDEGVTMAKIEVAALGAIDTGGLEASIGHGAFDAEARTGVIYAGAYYAFFVEYGTGVVGAAHPHPEPDTAGIGGEGNLLAMTYTGYDTNQHGEKGWWYVSDVDGKLHWTKGMKSRPFMYNTMMYLKNYVEREGGRIVASFMPGRG